MNYKMNYNFWTQKEIKFLHDNYSSMLTSDIATILNRPLGGVFGKANILGIKKSKEYMAEHLKKEAIKLSELGKKHRFVKGQIAHNKGVPMSSSNYAKLKKTMYKKGNLPDNTKEIYTERINKDGYTYIKVITKKWVLKHRYIYELTHGKIPKNCIVIFKDKNQKNYDIANLEMITKFENMNRNTIHNYPETIKQVIKLTTKLKKKINEKQN